MRVEEIEKLLLRLVKEPGYKPFKPRVLAKRLELAEDDTRDLKRAIKQLVKKGLLVTAPITWSARRPRATAAPRRAATA